MDTVFNGKNFSEADYHLCMRDNM